MSEDPTQPNSEPGNDGKPPDPPELDLSLDLETRVRNLEIDRAKKGWKLAGLIVAVLSPTIAMIALIVGINSQKKALDVATQAISADTKLQLTANLFGRIGERWVFIRDSAVPETQYSFGSVDQAEILYLAYGLRPIIEDKEGETRIIALVEAIIKGMQARNTLKRLHGKSPVDLTNENDENTAEGQWASARRDLRAAIDKLADKEETLVERSLTEIDIPGTDAVKSGDTYKSVATSLETLTDHLIEALVKHSQLQVP